MKYVILFLTVISLTSCFKRAYVYKNSGLYPNNEVYKIGPSISTPSGTGTIPDRTNTVQKVTSKGIVAEISAKDNYLSIKPKNPSDLKPETYLVKKPLTGWRADIPQKDYFFGDVSTLGLVNNSNPADTLDKGNKKYKLSYFNSKVVLQALTIPIKIRPALKGQQYGDLFPGQVETGFSANLAAGVKFNHNMYNSNKNVFGNNTTTVSFTPGVFFGFGAADLKKTNTLNPAITVERKALIRSYGYFLMFGVHNINLGYAMGWDYATGTGSSQWVYKGKKWHGIVVAFDLIK